MIADDFFKFELKEKNIFQMVEKISVKNGKW